MEQVPKAPIDRINDLETIVIYLAGATNIEDALATAEAHHKAKSGSKPKESKK